MYADHSKPILFSRLSIFVLTNKNIQMCSLKTSESFRKEEDVSDRSGSNTEFSSNE